MSKSKKWYYCFWATKKVFDSCSTEKAFYTYYDPGYITGGHERPVWFPKSQCIFGEVNEVGNFELLIPCWLVDDKTNFKPMALDFEYTGRIQQ